MKELVVILESLGSPKVMTYIQSGNVVLQNEEEDAFLLASKISAEVKKTHGFEPHVLLLTPNDIKKDDCRESIPRGENRIANIASRVSGFKTVQPRSE